MTERDCTETLRELEAFLDGEMADVELLEVRTHLSGCPDCLQAFDFHAELKLAIARKCHADEIPTGLLARLEECCRAQGDADPTGHDESGTVHPSPS